VLTFESPIMNQNGTVASTSVVFRHVYTLYRPGKIYDRISIDNGSASTITFALYQYNLHSSWTAFTGEGNAWPANIGWDDPYWQGARACQGGSVSYAPCTPSPWGYISDLSTNSKSASAWLMHSIQGTYSASAPAITVSGTGVTNYLNSPGTTFTLKSDFLEILHEDAGSASAAYAAESAAGIRSKLLMSGLTAPVGTDQLPKHMMLWVGDNGIRSQANAALRATEYNSPPSPTMSVGTSSGFDYGSRTAGCGCWNLTASSNSISLTTAGTMYYPAFKISSYSNAVPSTIRIGGVTKALDTDYVAVKLDATTLLLQVMSTVSNGTSIQIP